MTRYQKTGKNCKRECAESCGTLAYQRMLRSISKLHAGL